MPMVLLDWRMPNLTGLEVLRCLRHAADKAPRLVARFINFLAGIIKRGGPKASYSYWFVSRGAGRSLARLEIPMRP